MNALLLVILPFLVAMRANDAKLLQILRDPLPWGSDIPAVLNSLPAFESAGLRHVSILPYRIVSVRRFGRQADAIAAAAAATRALRVLARGGKGPTVTLRAVVSPDDRRTHVGTPVDDDSHDYLAEGVRIEQVVQHFGKAERTRTEVFDDGTDRRPLQLTIYEYAGGAVGIATSNGHDVDRVQIDVRAALRVLRKGNER